jgi:hypothetical protein
MDKDHPNRHNGRTPHTIEEAFGPGARFDPAPGPSRFNRWDVLLWVGFFGLVALVYLMFQALPGLWP